MQKTASEQLSSLKEKALESMNLLTFKTENMKSRASGTGNVIFQATCDDANQTKVTFWETVADRVIDVIGEGEFRLKPDTIVSQRGELIPGGSQKDWFGKE